MKTPTQLAGEDEVLSCVQTDVSGNQFNHVDDVVHYFIVRCDTKNGGGENVFFIKWSGLRFELLIKYRWYFNYRAALLQIQYPKYIVETKWGYETAVGLTAKFLYKRKLTSKKQK